MHQIVPLPLAVQRPQVAGEVVRERLDLDLGFGPEDPGLVLLQLLLTLAGFVVFASGVISRFLRLLLPHMHRITGAVLALSGGYLLLYWLPQLLGRGPGSTALAGPAGALAIWISGHQLLITVIALALTVTVAITALLRRLRGTPPRPSRTAPSAAEKREP